ncbi:hypothetical protein ACROYT_G004552 [Oculina patagonica]
MKLGSRLAASLSVQQIDILGDAYKSDKRGRGVRRRVEADVRLPDSWGESLRRVNKKLILYVRAQQDISILRTREEHSMGHMDVLGDQATIAFMVLSKTPSVQDVLNAMPVLKD